MKELQSDQASQDRHHWLPAHVRYLTLASSPAFLYAFPHSSGCATLLAAEMGFSSLWLCDTVLCYHALQANLIFQCIITHWGRTPSHFKLLTKRLNDKTINQLNHILCSRHFFIFVVLLLWFSLQHTPKTSRLRM